MSTPLSDGSMLPRGRLLAVAATLAAGVPTCLASAQLAADSKFGAYLAGECTACHRPGPARDGIPAIFGLSESTFIAAMEGYRSGQREATVMRPIAAAFSDREIEALAHYFAARAPR